MLRRSRPHRSRIARPAASLTSNAMDRWLRRTGVVDGQRAVDRARHVDPHDVGAEVTEQHAAERARTECRPSSRSARRAAVRSPLPSALRASAHRRPLLPSGRGVVGGVAEHLVSVLEIHRPAESRGIGIHLQRTLGQLHTERRQSRQLSTRSPSHGRARRSGSTSSLTRPRRLASSADTVRPVSIQSAATLVPTILGR